MKKHVSYLAVVLLIKLSMSSCSNSKMMEIDVFETSESGNKLQRITEFPIAENKVEVTILPQEKFQTITGFGGSFTEASAAFC